MPTQVTRKYLKSAIKSQISTFRFANTGIVFNLNGCFDFAFLRLVNRLQLFPIAALLPDVVESSRI
jgi:hypothetical protein